MVTRVWIHDGDVEQAASVTRSDAGGEVTIAGVDGAVQVIPQDDGRLAVVQGEARATAIAAVRGERIWVQIGPDVFVFDAGLGTRRRGAARAQDALTPPMSATVVRIAVAVGDDVAAGDLLMALEAMKMELPIRAPRAGRIAAIHCREGELVQPGTTLIEFSPRQD